MITDQEVKRRTDSGSTGLAVYQEGKVLTVGCAGDSRAVLITDSGPVRLSVDNKATNPSGIWRASQAGGRVVNGRIEVGCGKQIAVSRSLGDRDFGRALTAEPNVITHFLNPKDRALVLVCDGITDVITDEQLPALVKLSGYPSRASWTLVNEAYARGSRDNLSAMVVGFPNVQQESILYKVLSCIFGK